MSTFNDLIINLISSAPEGNHKLTLVSEGGSARMLFSTGKSEVFTDETLPEFMEFAWEAFAGGGQGGLTLRSFPGRVVKDGWDSDVSKLEEVRGWVVVDSEVHPLGSQSVLNMYCMDAVTGELLDPEPNVRYCDAEGFPV